MRGLTAQFLLPVVSLGVSIALGWTLGSTSWGIVAGVVLACVVAGLLARRIYQRLRVMQRWARFADTTAHHVPPSTVLRDEVDETVSDIEHMLTSVRRQMQSLVMQLQQQTLVLDRMNDGLMRVVADGRVSYGNVAAGTLFGGRNPVGRSFIGVTRDHELNQALRRCLDTGEEQHHTFEIPGEGRILDAVIVRIGEHPAEALVMARDITEVNRLQHLRRDFVSNVSHELRTPLATIKILTETLLEIRGEDEEAARFLQKIDAEVDSMTALVRDLLDLTRLETLGGRLALRLIDVEVLVTDVCDRMRPLAESHDIHLRAELADDIGSAVLDERRMHQALINLVTNAVAHTPPGGEVTISARGTAASVTFVVRDTGRGITEDDLPRIWERFFKTDRARTGPGTGLGLAIVKHIVQAHLGSVSAESKVGSGSVFYIDIPRGAVDDYRAALVDIERTYVPG
jgi:two-component system, OmpR family, phosphate regulon sensor histidine kinase PhoR